MKRWIDHCDKCVVDWMKNHGSRYLRYSLAIIFIWFGFLKIIDMSPAADLVARTVFWWDQSWFFPLLGTVECLIGVLFLFKKTIRIAVFIMALQMVGTFFPFFMLPELTFNGSIFYPTMEGQYIIKNIVLIAAAILVGSHARDKPKPRKRR